MGVPPPGGDTVTVTVTGVPHVVVLAERPIAVVDVELVTVSDLFALVEPPKSVLATNCAESVWDPTLRGLIPVEGTTSTAMPDPLVVADPISVAES